MQVENSVLVHTEKRTDHMKRYGNLFEKICSMENLELAFKNAKKGKGWYREVKQIEKKTILLLGGSAMDDEKPPIQNFGICHFYEKGRQEGTGNIQTSILP